MSATLKSMRQLQIAFVALTLILAIPVFAQKLPTVDEPSCESSTACEGKAANLFGAIYQDAVEILKADSGLDIGSICFRLSRIITNYFELKKVNFNLLPMDKLEGKNLFDLLYLIGAINVPALDFCGMQSPENKNDLTFIKDRVKILNSDLRLAISILKTNSGGSPGHTVQ